MSTNAIIAVKNNDSYKYIYLHWDGYPERTGNVLLRCYNTNEIVQELISLGDLSRLCDKIKPFDNEEHSFNNRAENTTVAYHRDRGDAKNACTHGVLNEFQFRNVAKNYEYVYVWDENTSAWFCNGNKLTDTLAQKDKKTVEFGMVWQCYGRQTVELPDDIDSTDINAVKNYIKSIWKDIELPEGDYLPESDELDEDGDFDIF